MKKITVSGASDDLVEIEGGIRDEFSHYDSDALLHFISESEGTVFVTATYTPNGTWAIGLAPGDDGIGLPSWNFQLGMAGSCDYSAALTFEAPDDIYVLDVTK